MAESDFSNNVDYYFNLAIEQGTDFNLFFLLDRCPISHVHAPCVKVKNRHFVARAELEEIERNPIVWGADVRGYFTVRDNDVVNCHFTTRLARIYNGPLNSLYLVFPLPGVIDHNQRRFSRRVNIDRETASEFGIWTATLEGGDAETLPQAKWRPLHNYECELGELSASGLRLDVREDTALCERMGINDLILLKGDFGRPGKPFPLFVVGTVVRRMPKPDSEGIICFGCHFISWRKVAAREGQTWFKADPEEGIGQIAQWISRNFHSLAQ